MIKPQINIDGAQVFLGDCREVLEGFPDNSVDSIVTDPPYELGFMGKGWDSSGIAYDVNLWMHCLRVLKPGGHILAFGGSRTWHRLAVAIEDAGFEIRDNISWIYGSGFPKSLDVSKAIDKRAGAEREVVGQQSRQIGKGNWQVDDGGWQDSSKADENGVRTFDLTSPATSEAQQWEGWGTALKPAHEPVVVGRKPLVGTVAENVLEWGVGGLNIDACRIAGSYPVVPAKANSGRSNGLMGEPTAHPGTEPHAAGRWPANVILDEHTAGLLDEQSGVSVSKRSLMGSMTVEGSHEGWKRKSHAGFTSERGFDDSGGASRFFYVAKASKRDRNEGLEELEARVGGSMNGAEYREGKPTNHPVRENFHPTVKPTALMRYLIKLVTPPGGTVLDPFTGSGSTGKAALLDGFEFVGVELTEEYLPIIEGRLRWASEQVGDGDVTLF
jgi:site-specific DNA-methyltransferase (adenine-specific)